MSQSQVAARPAGGRDASGRPTRAVAGADAERLLEALSDGDSRAILDATRDEALSAREVSEACDLPLSTAYRKLTSLVEAGALAERTRIRRSGKHASEYTSVVEDVVVSVGADGLLELELSLAGDRCDVAADPAKRD